MSPLCIVVSIIMENHPAYVKASFILQTISGEEATARTVCVRDAVVKAPLKLQMQHSAIAACSIDLASASAVLHSPNQAKSPFLTGTLHQIESEPALGHQNQSELSGSRTSCISLSTLLTIKSWSTWRPEDLFMSGQSPGVSKALLRRGARWNLGDAAALVVHFVKLLRSL